MCLALACGGVGVKGDWSTSTCSCVRVNPKSPGVYWPGYGLDFACKVELGGHSHYLYLAGHQYR